MELNKDLVREILLKLEADKRDPREPKHLEIPGHSEQEISYHVHLLAEAGFLEAIDLGDFAGDHWQPQRLTYSGHELLDTVRDSEIWRATKDNARKVGSASVQVLFELGKAAIKAKAMHLGIPM